MRRSRLASVPRLCRNALVRLLDSRTIVERRTRQSLTLSAKEIGCVERTLWKRHSVTIVGWCTSGALSFGFEGRMRHRIVPWIERREISSANAEVPLHCGFVAEIARPDTRSNVTICPEEYSDATPLLSIQPPGRLIENFARLRALPQAITYAARHRHDILRFIRTGDPGLAVALRDIFGFEDDALVAPLAPPDIFGPEVIDPALSSAATTVIIVPVYNAADDTEALLNRLDQTTDATCHLLLIDDGSTDPRIAPMLRDFRDKNRSRCTVERLSQNQGFVAAVNHGLSKARELGHHAVLLNTDTLPAEGWVARLLAPILADPSVASVTPVSNAAEIATIPAQHVETPLSVELVDRLDGVARRLAPAFRSVPIPTGIGFAMAMNRSFLDRIGHFDIAFGRGYGEETDWCQKARQIGGHHVLATSVFIGHKGGASFGSAEKQGRVQASARIISKRYPGYDREIQEWATTSPHAIPKIALSFAWLDQVSENPVPVFMGHVLGGGAELAMQAEIDTCLNAGSPAAVVLRAGGAAAWRIEIRARDFTQACRVQDIATMLVLLEPLRRRRVIYSCGVGARDAVSIPHSLLALGAEPTDSLEIRLHDYFPVSPSYCLLGSDGRFAGVPSANSPDPAHCIPVRGDHPGTSLRQWRELWSEVISRAEMVTAFSPSSAAIMTAAYPEAATKLSVMPHDLPDALPARIDPNGRNIGVLGAINQAKGADVLMSLARHMRAMRNPRRIIIVGELDPNYRLPPPHLALGRYERRQISNLAKQHGIGLWLIPSIWPETFSFTTREALATGLPVLTFDLGAQGEAARYAENGHVMACGPDEISEIFEEIETCFSAQSNVKP
jgi:GT2 family glycosyltransferase